ncbi:TRAP transporter substrate-binding protein [Lacrimispora sp. 210928-DFI.3.58]|uniref:TRAP transporter substrate-binding protein n=1 Tax=Lacrimispora sp. 210928-DFI.3.58 TaxID=2883214 RepID=UPI001D0950DC|nr:TRAP transporter substrate-binding protein [Lacrimispora sp. 210928-DFI.3.58]MCB7320724.1 TRAP transporter substrate-binding protein [Lacrimispora sp. 210928-DFI.3.58]
MRKTMALLLSLAMAASLTACGGGNKAAETTAAPAAPAATEAAKEEAPAGEAEAAPEAVADLGDFTMIVGHAQPEGNPRYVSMEKFAADVAEKTGGHVTVEVYGNGQLGTEKEMLEQVVAGTVQGMRGGQFDFSPRLLMFTLPFLTQNRAQITALLQSDLAKKVCEEAEAETGTVIINLCDAGGYRQFSNSKHAITKPEDLKGLKMRTNGMNTIDKTFIALGATTTTIPYSDLYMGLKTAVADGQENPWVNVEGMKFYEVQQYFTEVNYQFHPDPFYVNAGWWNSLPAEYQAIIQECATEMGTYNDQLIDENQNAAKQVVIDAGCEVYEPTEEELAAFQEAVQVVYDQCIEEGMLTAEELQEMQDIVANAK